MALLFKMFHAFNGAQFPYFIENATFKQDSIAYSQQNNAVSMLQALI